jgi:hypothetical protein
MTIYSIVKGTEAWYTKEKGPFWGKRLCKEGTFMYCRHCGKKLPEDSNFCPGCGTPCSAPLPPEEENITPPVKLEEQDPPEQKKEKKKITFPQGPKRPSIKMSGKKKFLPLVVLCGVVVLAVVVMFAMPMKTVKCPDPYYYLGISTEEKLRPWEYEGDYNYDFDSSYPSNISNETAWEAVRLYGIILEDYGAEVKALDKSNISDRYLVEADFGSTSLIGGTRRRLTVTYYLSEKQWFIDNDLGKWDFVSKGDPLVTTQQKENTEKQQTSSQTKTSSSSTTMPDFGEFTNNNAKLQKTTEKDGYTEYYYLWNYNSKALEEYLELLKENNFKLRMAKEFSTQKTTWNVFDYTGSGDVETFDVEMVSGSDGEEMSLFVLENHKETDNAALRIYVGKGLKYQDTGIRTAQKLTPYQKKSSDSSDSSSDSSYTFRSAAERNCITCSGTGKCRQCGGSGRVSKWVAGTREYVEQNCIQCLGSGKCYDCRGTGQK